MKNTSEQSQNTKQASSDPNHLDHMRHSLAHLLAAAVLELYPSALPSIGPAIENGFYYDFEFPTPFSEKDLKKVEKKMRYLLKGWNDFERIETTASEAKERFKHNPYKIELIDEIVEKEEDISLYKSGEFTDLCRGGHVDAPNKDINPKAFKLDRVAGAYWRGNENNTMLTRIYGLAFETPEELEEYLNMQEEAKKRDHRKLGKELDLFTFSDLVGPGLPLWTPKGTLLRNLLDDYVWQLRKERGYERVEISHITKKDLYETSGHWDKFGDELFRTTTREGHEFVMKPMNCPHHTQIFDRVKHSYRDMPQRYANTTMCYRDEQTGELHGLSRVRSFTQDDAHVFCRENQVKEEAFKIWDIVETFYKSFGFELHIHLSTHDPEKMENYLGDLAVWDEAVGNLRSWLEERNAEYFEDVGEAAFYGPKIDFVARDSLGREWQVATIQVDRSMPKNFDLTCTNEDGEPERIVMLHAAIMGSIERFLSVYIEHAGGKFPLWLSPVQIKILPIADAHKDFAEKVFAELKEAGIRVELDDSNETLGKKIRNWKLEKVPYAIIIGEKEAESGKLTLENRDSNEKEKLGVEELVEKLQKQITERK